MEQTAEERSERREAILDLDGTHAPTGGECKEGIGLSYDGQWCYHAFLLSLANTMEPLLSGEPSRQLCPP